MLYNRRSKFNPLWNQIVCAGCDGKTPFLGYVDMQGTTFKDDIVATGYGAYLATPVLRKNWRPDLTEDEAKSLLESAMKVLVYRDCQTINKFQIAKVTTEGAAISPPYSIDTKWNFQRFVNPNMA